MTFCFTILLADVLQIILCYSFIFVAVKFEGFPSCRIVHFLLSFFRFFKLLSMKNMTEDMKGTTIILVGFVLQVQ